ncbi:MAG TPA: hypothetical protein V6C97_01660 [Oculatellaceae cyanobacterium]
MTISTQLHEELAFIATAPTETANSVMKKAITQAVKARASQNAAKFPKNNHFCYRWRIVDEFNRSIDRDMHNARIFGGDFPQSLVNQRVLSTFKTTKLKFNQDFMQQITEDALEFLEGRKKKAVEINELEALYAKSGAAVLQGLFDILLSCSIEFNTRLGFTELFIASMEPEMMTFTTPTAKTTSLRARFSTSHFSLVMNGYKNELKFFLLPVEDLMGLSSMGYGREAFLTIKGDVTEEGVIWNTEHGMLTEDDAEKICLEAMKRLVEQTCTVLAHTTPSI